MTTSATTAVKLDDDQRNVLAGLADELVPNALGMPAASEVDVPGVWIDRALAARPDLGPMLSRVLERARDTEPAEALERLNENDPELVSAFGTLVMGAYYLNPEVRERLGYPGQPNDPPKPGESDEYLEGGLLDPVRDRGPVFRSTPS